MLRVCVGIILLCTIGAVSLADQVPGVQVKVDIAYLTKFLDQMKLKYETTADKGFAHMIMVGDHAKYETYVIADTESALAFVIIRNYMTVKPDNRNADKVLRHLMQLNWKLNVGKFEWNPDDGEVRLTFTFSTEEGIGFNAFKAVFDTLTNTADDKYEECQKILTAD